MIELPAFLKSLTSLNKLPAKIVVFVCVASGLLLFLPASWLGKIRLGKFVEDFGQWIGATFFLSLVFLLILSASYVIRTLTVKRRLAKIREKVSEEMERLDRAELLVLREFIIQGQTAIKLPIDQPTVAGLIEKRILEQVGSYGQRNRFGLVFPVKLTRFAEPFYSHELVGLPEVPTEAEKAEVFRLRPDFVEAIIDSDRRRHGTFYR